MTDHSHTTRSAAICSEADRVRAFADGELEPVRAAEMLSASARDSSLAERVRFEQGLREAVGRSMRGRGQGAPEALRSQIAAMASRQQAAGLPTASGGLVVSGSPKPGVLATLSRWVPTAAAAVLLIAALLVAVYNPNPAGPGGYGPSAIAIAPLSNQKLAAFASRHDQCVSDPSMLEEAELFPDTVEALPGALGDYFGEQVHAKVPVDLSVLGYQYVQAGKCPIAGGGAVHVVYRAADGSAGRDALSLWIIPDSGKFDLAEGRLYRGQDAQGTRPTLMWRRGAMVYLLVGDRREGVERAAAVLRTGS